MKKEELRAEFQRLSFPKTLKDADDVIEIYLNYLFIVITNKTYNQVNTTAERDAKLIIQMMFTKLSHLKEALKGIEFRARDGSQLNRIIDPTFLAVLIRNIYETTAMFNIVNIQAVTDDEKMILHNLWVIAGLSYRQKFVDETSTEENKAKIQAEKTQIDQYVQQIESSNLYQNLSAKSQKKFKQK